MVLEQTSEAFDELLPFGCPAPLESSLPQDISESFAHRLNDLLSEHEADSPEIDEPRSGIVDAGYSRMFAVDIIKNIPNGTLNKPSMLLEIGGGKAARPYPLEEMKRRHIMIGNIDTEPRWGDRRQPCDLRSLQNGLESGELAEFFEGVTLGKVIISHVVKFLDSATFKSLVRTALPKLPPGGSFVLQDMNVDEKLFAKLRKSFEKGDKKISEEQREFLYGRLYKAVACMERIADLSSEYGLRYSLLGPPLSRHIVDKMGQDPREALTLLRATVKNGEASHVKFPVTRETVSREHAYHSKIINPANMELVLELEKIDLEKQRMMKREKNRQERSERKKQKMKRKKK